MKTKLLYLASFMLVLVTSCTVDENHQLSDQEKELKVKNLVKIFSEDVMPSASYSKFVNQIKSKSSYGLTQDEINQLEQEFLSQQTQEFVALYNFVVTLNLTEDELRMIITDFIVFDSGLKNQSKDDSDECAELNNTDGDDFFFIIIAKILCEVRSS